MIVELKGVQFDFTKLRKFYPAALIKSMMGDETQISIDWYKSNKDNKDIELVNYILVVYQNEDFIQIPFDDLDELEAVVNEIHIVKDRMLGIKR